MGRNPAKNRVPLRRGLHARGQLFGALALAFAHFERQEDLDVDPSPKVVEHGAFAPRGLGDAVPERV
jgi:hypothetical protein